MTLGCGSTRWKRTCGITITSLIVNLTVGTDTDFRIPIQIQTVDALMFLKRFRVMFIFFVQADQATRKHQLPHVSSSPTPTFDSSFS
ncbi:hypothetical protein CCUS01_08001 [Colletotrichum cuscutae]|uniref:Uncharacterized protein n=1 Tax=Colletotrichum cuscutae TaxID=1209917 RepID=A0AAI9UWT8_9PEZI|nr:hypothetical protein CCUS01_08001 [Colletotrichum cuscutae]